MNRAVDLFGRPAAEQRAVRQLPLPLGWQADERPFDGLYLSDSNRGFVESVKDVARWVSPVAVLSGPPRSGRTLLAAHLVAQVPAVHYQDDADGAAEEAVFHACTAALNDRTPLLLVAARGWQPRLPDLATRIAAAQHFDVPDPDPDLIAALLLKRLNDQAISVTPALALVAATQLERSFAAVDAFVSAMADAALLHGRKPSAALVRMVADSVGDGSGSAVPRRAAGSGLAAA